MSLRSVFLPVLLTIIEAGCHGTSPRPTETEVTAEVIKLNLAAIWDHYERGAVEAFDQVVLRVRAPSELAGKLIEVNLLGKVSAPWKVGVVCTFSLRPGVNLGEAHPDDLKNLRCGS